MDWLEGIRQSYQQRKRQHLIASLILFAVWLGGSGLGLWIWVAWFHHLPPPQFLLGAFTLYGGALVAIFLRVVPVTPLSKRPPEEIAAEAFFSGRAVGPDDGVFHSKYDS
jgi:hypothetical protein